MRYFVHLIVFLAGLSGSLLCAQTFSTYHILSQEQESLQCRLDLIEQARKEIWISTYAIKDDAVGLATLQLLIKAAHRGVSVQILVDDYDNGLPDCLFTYLEAQGVHSKVFNILNPFKLRTIVDRMHGKMLIVDGRAIIIGGRNLTEKYFLLDSINNFLDREVYIVSKSTAQHARQHFQELWDNPKLSGQKQSTLSDSQMICWRVALEKAPFEAQKRLQLAPIGQKDWNTGFKKTTQPVHFIHDNRSYSQRRKGRRWRTRKDRQATTQLIALVSKADSRIDFENPYFIPTHRWRIALKKCLERGVKIRVLTNSSYTNDLPIIQAVYLNRRARSLRAGIEIWEYHGAKMLHTKAILIDNHISVIGSYNLELFSHKFNTEVMVWVDDPQLAVEHGRFMNSVLQKSVRLGDKSAHSGKRLSPNKTQRKRHRKVQILRYTVAPLLGVLL